MAVMHPIDIENYEYTPTEKEMYCALKDQLPDKYQVFYSVRWFETIDSKRVDSESDFLIFDPSFGFIALEVKGGTGITVLNGNWTLLEEYNASNSSSRELKCSPYEQAEKSMRHFKNYFVSEFNQNYNGVYGFAVAFPRYAIESQLAQDAPPEITIDLNDMTSLREKINQIFHYWKNKRNITIPFSAEQRNRFLTAINKQISMSAAAGALIPIKEKEFAKIDFVQDSILDCLNNYRQVQIVGGAGTGKTFIGIKKAVRDALNGKKVLFVCCNEELSEFVKSKLSQYTTVNVFTYVELMKKLLGKTYDELPTNSNGNKSCFEYIDDVPVEKKYDSIVVDEAQDFDIDMGLTIRSLLIDDGKSSLYVFYDKNQNVFEMNSENAFAIDAPPYVLRYNIRNTGCIYQCAVERTNLGRDTIANNIMGVSPEIYNYSKPSQAIKALSLIVNRLVQKEYVPSESIVIVSDIPYANSILAGETRVGAYDLVFKHYKDVGKNEICFKTAAEFKGLEANVVIYLTHEFTNLPSTIIDNRKEYVAITRARYYLYVLNTKCKASIGD
jgi:hypothetical protein